MPLDLAPPYVLLEDRSALDGDVRLYVQPEQVISARTAADVRPALAHLDQARASGRHLAGFIAYEAFAAFEPRVAEATKETDGAPLLWFGVFAGFTSLSAAAVDSELASQGPPPPLGDLRPEICAERHQARVRRVLDLIAQGDLYQANLTFPLSFRYAGRPLALYAALRARQPVAHGGVVATGEQTILSVSPELFISARDGRLTARPMKGTAPRGATPEADRSAAQHLSSDPKSRAENLMITDLLRNDLSRIGLTGSVRTPALFTLETYPTFHTLTSTVEAAAPASLGLSQLMSALFPCGSVVGAPKIRAAEVIANLEAHPRGAYTGALGWAAPSGDLAFNVAIRTAVLGADGRGGYGVGGGIVADSDPEAEWREALLKGRILSDLATPYGLIETLRWSPMSGFQRLREHLDRLTKSAALLGFPGTRADWSAALESHAAAWPRHADLRVRAELGRDGRLDVTTQPAPTAPHGPVMLHLATVTLDAADPFLRHKTTRREAYEAAFAEAAAFGCDEAVLLNRAGHVADASRNSLFVQRGGQLITPPVEAGALPGVLRAVLIGEGRAVEGDLGPDDLTDGVLWLGNSLNGLRPARLARQIA